MPSVDPEAVPRISAASRVVLFGSAGFVGSQVAVALKAAGHALVHPTRAEVDLLDFESVRGCLRPDDVVINAAGYADATDRSAMGRLRFQEANVDAVEILARACRSRASRQLIHVSSVAAMGRVVGEGLTEEARGPIESPYAASKRAGEQVLDRYSDSLPVTILRPTSVFGEGRGLAGALCRVARLPMIPLPGGDDARIPFTYVGNVAEAVALTVGAEACLGRTFVVGDSDSYRLREVVWALAVAMGRQPRFLPMPHAVASAAVTGATWLAHLRGAEPVLDRGRLATITGRVSYRIDAFQRATGYVPRVGLQEAARRIARWFESGADHA